MYTFLGCIHTNSEAGWLLRPLITLLTTPSQHEQAQPALLALFGLQNVEHLTEHILSLIYCAPVQSSQ